MLFVLEEYIDQYGRNPFREWMKAIKDMKTSAIIDARLTRASLGNLGDSRSLGGGVFELKIDFGPGYRVYCGRKNKEIIVLLVAGNKKSQSQDISLAKSYWKDCMGEKSNEKK